MNRLVGSKSSYLVYWPVIGFLFIAAVLSIVFRLGILALVIMVFLLLAVVCRLWIIQGSRNMDIKMAEEFSGLYPGQTGYISFNIKNNKLIPVLWADLFFPLKKDICLVPEETRPSLEWEKIMLKELNASEDTVGEMRISSFSWYESRNIRVKWTAVKRGIYSTRGFSLRTGDGFGLGQSEQNLGKEYHRDLAVFPELIQVDSSFFIKNVWNSDTGARGIIEDNTVIRSVRDYMPGDNVRYINWRLTARSLPLSVNVYEEILPQNAFLIFDGESFSGPDPHPEEMEEALSIIGSAAKALAERNVRCGISMSKGDYDPVYSNVSVRNDLQELLWALAAYNPLPQLTDDDNKLIRQAALFDHSFIAEEARNAGKCYYIIYDPDLADHELIEMLGEGKVQILYFVPGSGKYTGTDIRRLRKTSKAADRTDRDGQDLAGSIPDGQKKGGR